MQREPRRKDPRPELAFQSRWHAGRARGSATGCSLRRRRGTRAERRDRSPEPRAAGESRSCCTRSSLGPVPAPEIPRLVLHAQPGLLGGRRGGARDGGGGGAPIHRRRCRPGLVYTPLSAGRWRTVPSSGPREEKKKKKKDKILRDSCSPRNRGGLAPYPFYMLRRLPPVQLGAGTPPGAPRERRAAGWKPRRALAEASGRRECRRGRPLLARAAVRATRERTTPRAAAALRRPLPARRSTTGRGDPRLQQGEPRGALRLASRPAPGAAPDRCQVSELRIRTLPSNRAGRTAAWWQSEHPPTYRSVGKRTALPPVLRLCGIAQSALWGRGPERTVPGKGMREDDIQLNEASF